MKKFILLFILLLIPLSAYALNPFTDGPFSGGPWTGTSVGGPGGPFGSGTGVAYDFRDEFSDTLAAGSVNGTLSTSGHVRTVVDTYATTELITNGGFETAGVGDPDFFGTWTETAGDGAIADEGTIVNAGSHAAKLTSGATSNTSLYQAFTTIPGKSYTLTFKTTGDGTNAGQYKVYNATGSADIVAIKTTGVVGSAPIAAEDYATVTETFTAPASCVSVRVYLYCPPTNTGIAYYDTISVLPTSGLLSIANGALTFAGGKATPAYGDPGIWWPSTARVAGKMLIWNNTLVDGSKVCMGGFDIDQTIYNELMNINYAGLLIKVYPASGVALLSVGDFSSGVTYYNAAISRLAGDFRIVKIGDVFKLEWINSAIADTQSPFYPNLSSYNANVSTSFIRIPSLRWVPQPLLSHNFYSLTPSDGAGHQEGFGTAPMIGDSLTNGIAPAFNTNAASTLALTNSGVGGDTLAQIQARLSSVIAGKRWVVIQGGINDLVSADASTNAAMEATMTAMINTCLSAGVTPVLVNVGPWKNQASWDATKQGYTDVYNAWLASYASTNSLPFFDMYSLMESPADTLNAAYDSGDGLHPNATGYALIAQSLKNIIPYGTGNFVSSLIGSGGSGVTLTGATWTASGGSVSNTPTEGEELLTNGEFTTNTTGWAGEAPATIARVDSASDPGTPSGGSDSYVLKVTAGSTTANGILTSAAAFSVGPWYKFSGLAYAPSSNTQVNAARLYPLTVALSQPTTRQVTAENSWQTVSSINRFTNVLNLYANVSNGGAFTEGDVGYFDSLSVKPLTLSSLFLTAPLSTANVLASVEITKTAATNGYQSGLVTNLDSASSPANFLIHYMDGAGNCKTDKNVAGTYTNIISAACTYSPGAPMAVVTDAGAVRLYYNNILVGTATVADAGVISNTIHGLFSTGSDTMDDLVIMPRGNEGQYAILNQFVN